MGVIGLWSILDAGARPVRLEALAKKRLAVDASIWIYQFLKAVRDKEGNVLKNAHVVGFFRRICKLLFHGIQPVFVFDGKAPLLKKQTLRNRKVLREGGRIDVAKTAGKILAVQMRKRAIEEAERQQQAQLGAPQEEEMPENPVYFEDLELRPAEVQKQRFKKLDQYHLPELDVDLDRAGSMNDPRIMTHEELQKYAADYEGGEDMNLYDFSKIDYDGDMFKSLPAADQYSILNAARLRSRLRMGLSTEQLTDMFPDRMAFSRFQIERVKERSDLTNRLMNMNGMNDIGVQRIASERGREYILVKNDTVDGGWSLGVVNSVDRPIVIDKELQQKAESDDEDVDFEDVAIGNDMEEGTRSTIGMTEEDMIKFAMEESRKAQMSTTKPDGDFRPSSRRKDIRAQKTRMSEMSTDPRPLFARDDSIQDTQPSGEVEIASDQGNVATLTGQQTWEEEEAEEMSKAIAMSLEQPESKSTDDEAGGGFILEDADGDEDDIKLPSAMPESKKQTREVRFQLPFEKLDFSRSLLSQAKQTPNVVQQGTTRDRNIDTTLPGRPLDKLQKAMKNVTDPEGVDIEAAKESEICSDQQSVVTSSPAIQPRSSVPTWFQEEIERPQARSSSGVSETRQEAPSFGFTSATDGPIDLTREESDMPTSDKALSSASSTSGEVDIIEPEQEVITNANTNPEAALSTDINIDADAIQDASATLEHAADREDTIGSPDWTDADHQSPESQNHADPDSFQSRDDDQGGRSDEVPVLQHEDSVLDEADQTRLNEEEDMMNRMAAEEAEYARFSAELGNKRADNYTSVEYEQDLKALKNQQRKNLRDADEVTQIMVQECQELLAQFGIPYITAASEAESQCAQLVQLNLVDGIVTDDSDVFLFGGTRVYRNMFNTAKNVECYVLSDLEREFELDRDKLIKLAHLLGSDYTEGIKKIGPVLALELIGEFGGPTGLEDFRDYVDRVQTDRETEEDKISPFRKKFKKTAEKLVLPDNFPNPLVMNAYLHPEVDEDASNFEWGQPDVDALRSYLMRTCGWRQEYTDSQLLPVIKDMNVCKLWLILDSILTCKLKLREGTQRNLTDFFSGSIGAGAGGAAKKAVKSARMHNALSSLRGKSTEMSRKRKQPAARTNDAEVLQNSTEDCEMLPSTTTQKTRKKRMKKSTAQAEPETD